MLFLTAKTGDRWLGKGVNALIGSLSGAESIRAADNDGLWVGCADTP